MHALCWLEGAVGIVPGPPPASGSLGTAAGAAIAFPVFVKAEGGPATGWSSSAFAPGNGQRRCSMRYRRGSCSGMAEPVLAGHAVALYCDREP